MAGSSVEFRGKDGVLQAYNIFVEQSSTPFFSIWCQKDLRFAFKDDDNEASQNYLAQILDVLQSNGTQAIYQMRFHPELNKSGRIDNNTAYIGSFNFKMQDAVNMVQHLPYQPQQPVQSSGDKLLALLVERQITKVIEQVESAEQGPAETVGDTQEDFILRLMDNPMIQKVSGMVFDNISDFLSRGKNKRNDYQREPQRPGYQQPQPQPQGGGIAGIEDEEERIKSAIVRLYQIDKDLANNLTLLADIAEDDSDVYFKAVKKLKLYF